jgi:hypothetical protein
MVEISPTYKALDNSNVLYAVHYAEFNGVCRTLQLKGGGFSFRDDRELRKYLNKLGAFEDGVRYKLAVSENDQPRAKVKTMEFPSIYALVHWLVEGIHTTNRVAPFSTVLTTQELFSRGMESLMRTDRGRKENSKQHVFTGLPELGYLNSMLLLMSTNRFSAEVLARKWHDIIQKREHPWARTSDDCKACANKVLDTYKKVRGFSLAGTCKGIDIQFKVEKVDGHKTVQMLNATESVHALLGLMRTLHRVFDKLLLCAGQDTDLIRLKALIGAYVFLNKQLLAKPPKVAKSIANGISEVQSIILQYRKLSATVKGAVAKPATELVLKDKVVPADKPTAPNSFDPPAYAPNPTSDVVSASPEVPMDLLLEMRDMAGLKAKGIAALGDVKDPSARMLFKHLIATYFKD